MWNPQPDKIIQMFNTMCSKHRGEMHSAYLDWQLIQLMHPRYDTVIDQAVPLVVIDFK